MSPFLRLFPARHCGGVGGVLGGGVFVTGPELQSTGLGDEGAHFLVFNHISGFRLHVHVTTVSRERR